MTWVEGSSGLETKYEYTCFVCGKRIVSKQGRHVDGKFACRRHHKWNPEAKRYEVTGR